MKRLTLLAATCAVLVAADQRIKHVVVLMQENRPFDHLFGWASTPGNGAQSSSRLLMERMIAHPPHLLHRLEIRRPDGERVEPGGR